MTVEAEVRELPKRNKEPEVTGLKERPGGFGLLCAEVYAQYRFPFTAASLIGGGVYGDRLLAYAEEKSIDFPYRTDGFTGSVLHLKDPAGITMKMRVPGCEYDILYDELCEEDPDEIGKILVSGDMLTGEAPEDVLEYLFRIEKPAELAVTESLENITEDALNDLLERKPLIIAEDRYLGPLCGSPGDLKSTCGQLCALTGKDVIVLQRGTGVFVAHGKELTLLKQKEAVDSELFAAVVSAALSAGLTVIKAAVYAASVSSDPHARSRLAQGKWEYERQKLKEAILEK